MSWSRHEDANVETPDEVVKLTKKLGRQTHLFEAILSSISDFAYIFDRDGRFIFVNQALLDLWGLKLEAALGRNFFDLNYPADLATTLQRQIQLVFESRQRVTDETLYISPTGVAGYYEYIFSPFIGSDGAVELVVGTTRNITERKQAEEKIRTLSERATETSWKASTTRFSPWIAIGGSRMSTRRRSVFWIENQAIYWARYSGNSIPGSRGRSSRRPTAGQRTTTLLPESPLTIRITPDGMKPIRILHPAESPSISEMSPSAFRWNRP